MNRKKISEKAQLTTIDIICDRQEQEIIFTALLWCQIKPGWKYGERKLRMLC
jgi:hypothetical protein